MSVEAIEFYAAPIDRYDCDELNSFKLDHTWLSTESGPHNWNCYGRGRDNNHDPDARLMGVAHGNVQWMAINMRNLSGLQMNKARRSTERGGAYGEYAYIIRVFIKYR